MNQSQKHFSTCKVNVFVIACNSADENMAKGSAIINPFGIVKKMIKMR